MKILIVTQYFYPEFLLFQRLFEEHQIKTIIVDPNECLIKNKKLYAKNLPIDLVYNRLNNRPVGRTSNNFLP